MTTTEKRHIHEIAARSLRLGMSPAHVAADESEREFVRHYSANVWDEIAAIRAGKTPADHTIPGVPGPRPNDHDVPDKPTPGDVEDEGQEVEEACPACNGSGMDEDGKCSECGGTGKRRAKKLDEDGDEDEPEQEPEEDEDQEACIRWVHGFPVKVRE